MLSPMRILGILIFIFGGFAGALTFHRFVDVAGRAGAGTLAMILLFCALPWIFGLSLFQVFLRKKNIGFWLMAVFCLYIMVRHTFVYFGSQSRTNAFAVPDHIEQQINISMLDILYASEIVTGVALIFFTMIYRRKGQPASSG
jgi:hypothetical protein